jgi:lipid II:glycine glycyltransferase (peptidoglycan interpeptide bridge formation enzyme)
LLRWCKNEGITQFDFGGVNSFDEPNGIAQFKMKFEDNNRVTYNNYLVPNNFLGKIALKIFMRKRG